MEKTKLRINIKLNFMNIRFDKLLIVLRIEL